MLTQLEKIALLLQQQYQATHKPAKHRVSDPKAVVYITFAGDLLSITRNDRPPTAAEAIIIKNAFGFYSWHVSERKSEGAWHIIRLAPHVPVALVQASMFGEAAQSAYEV